MCGMMSVIPNGDKISTENLNAYLRILGYAQDKRGGDGSGIFYITDQEAYIAKNYNEPVIGQLPTTVDVTLKKLIKDEKPDLKGLSILLAHSRKTTIGINSEENTQPIVNNHIVLIHNGTVTNWEQLAKKYKLAVSSDSNLFAAYLAEHENYSILEEYEGTASLIWIDMTNPQLVYFFAGKSGEYIERNLFMLHTESGVFLSSLIQPLEAVAAHMDTVEIPFQFKTNTVFAFDVISRVTMQIASIERKEIKPKPDISNKSNSNPTKRVVVTGFNPPKSPDNKIKWENEGFYSLNGDLLESVNFNPESDYQINPIKVDYIGKVNKNGEYEIFASKGLIFRSREILEEFVKRSYSFDLENLKDKLIHPYAMSSVYEDCDDRTNIWFSEDGTLILNKDVFIPFTDIQLEFRNGVLKNTTTIPNSEIENKLFETLYEYI